MKNEIVIERSSKISADEFVHKLDGGIDTILGELLCRPSDGQMQRIAAARAIFSDNPILLDESTSALDEQKPRKIIRKSAEYDR